MSDSWKNEGGKKINNIVNANTDITNKYFSTDPTLSETDREGIYYFQESGSTTLGIGTKNPYSRISFGDFSVNNLDSTGSFINENLVNNPAIAFSETAAGTNATGISFFRDGAQITGASERRGLRFTVNNNPSGTLSNSSLETSAILNENTLMMMLNDGETRKVLINSKESLFQNTGNGLEVNGDLRSTKSLVLKGVEETTVNKEAGLIFYDKNTRSLKWCVGASDDVREIAGKNDTAFVIDASKYDASFAVIENIAKSTAVLAFKDLPFAIGNGEMINNRFLAAATGLNSADYVAENIPAFSIIGSSQAGVNSNGNVLISHIDHITGEPILSNTSSSDLSANGVLYLLNNLAIDTFTPSSIIDVSKNNVPFINVGVNNTNYNNSIIIGSDISGSEDSFYFGKTIYNNGSSTNKNNFIIGNTINIRGDNNFVFGNTISFFGNGNNKNNLIIGEIHNITVDTSMCNVIIFGDNGQWKDSDPNDKNDLMNYYEHGNKIFNLRRGGHLSITGDLDIDDLINLKRMIAQQSIDIGIKAENEITDIPLRIKYDIQSGTDIGNTNKDMVYDKQGQFHIISEAKTENGTNKAPVVLKMGVDHITHKGIGFINVVNDGDVNETKPLFLQPNSSNVAIGYISAKEPSAKLHVLYQSTNYDINSDNHAVTISTSSTSNNDVHFGFDDSNGAYINSNTHILLNPDSNSSSRCVGVGTDSPNELLHVKGNIKSEKTVGEVELIITSNGLHSHVKNDNGNMKIYTETGNDILLQHNNGSVGINVSSVYDDTGNNKLHVNGNVLINDGYASNRGVNIGYKSNVPTIDLNSSTSVGSIHFINTTNSNPGYKYDGKIGYSSNSIGFYVNQSSTPDFIIKDNGNVGVGTTNPQYKLEVDGQLAITQLIVGGVPFDATAVSTWYSSNTDSDSILSSIKVGVKYEQPPNSKIFDPIYDLDVNGTSRQKNTILGSITQCVIPKQVDIINSYTTTLNQPNQFMNLYNGVYDISEVEVTGNTANPAWHLFDNSGNTKWSSSLLTDTTMVGISSETVNVSVTGKHFEITLPKKWRLKEYIFEKNNDITDTSIPKKWYVFGRTSSTDTEWKLIDERNIAINWANTASSANYQINNYEYSKELYIQYRFIISETFAETTNVTTELANVYLFGETETLDTTKNFIQSSFADTRTTNKPNKPLILQPYGNRVGIRTLHPTVIVDISDNGAIRIPTGSTQNAIDINADITGKKGYLRYNTDKELFEGYDGSSWNGLGGVVSTNLLNKVEAIDTSGVIVFTSDNEVLHVDNSGNVIVKNVTNEENKFISEVDISSINVYARQFYSDNMLLDGGEILKNTHPRDLVEQFVMVDSNTGFFDVTYDSDEQLFFLNNQTVELKLLPKSKIVFKLSALDNSFNIFEGNAANLTGTTPNGLVHVSEDGTITTGDSANNKRSGTLIWNIPSNIVGDYRYQSGDIVSNKGNIQILPVISDISAQQINVDNLISENIQATSLTLSSIAAATTTSTNMTVDGILDVADKIGINTSTPNISLEIIGTDAIKIPSGTTAEKNSISNISGAGYIRFNTDDSQFEGYNGTIWTGLGGVISPNQKTTIEANDATNQGLVFFVNSNDITPTKSEIMRMLGDGKIGIGTQTPLSELHIHGTGAIKIPAGDDSERPSGLSTTQGYMRFNTTNAQFEGYNGSAWIGLGGVIDVDQDTKIVADDGNDDDTLRFFTVGQERMKIDETGKTHIIDLSANNAELKDISTNTIKTNNLKLGKLETFNNVTLSELSTKSENSDVITAYSDHLYLDISIVNNEITVNNTHRYKVNNISTEITEIIVYPGTKLEININTEINQDNIGDNVEYSVNLFKGGVGETFAAIKKISDNDVAGTLVYIDENGNKSYNLDTYSDTLGNITKMNGTLIFYVGYNSIGTYRIASPHPSVTNNNNTVKDLLITVKSLPSKIDNRVTENGEGTITTDDLSTNTIVATQLTGAQQITSENATITDVVVDNTIKIGGSANGISINKTDDTVSTLRIDSDLSANNIFSNNIDISETLTVSGDLSGNNALFYDVSVNRLWIGEVEMLGYIPGNVGQSESSAVADLSGNFIVRGSTTMDDLSAASVDISENLNVPHQENTVTVGNKGDLRFNSTENKFEGYLDGTGWQSLGGANLGDSDLFEMRDVSYNHLLVNGGDTLIWNDVNNRWEAGQGGANLATSELRDISDVDYTVSSLVGDEVLKWNNSDKKWQPGAVSGGIFTQSASNYNGIVENSITYYEDFSTAYETENYARYTATFSVTHDFGTPVTISDMTIDLIYAKFGWDKIGSSIDKTQTAIKRYGSTGQSWVIGLLDTTDNLLKIILLELTMSQGSDNTKINVLRDVIQSKKISTSGLSSNWENELDTIYDSTSNTEGYGIDEIVYIIKPTDSTFLGIGTETPLSKVQIAGDYGLTISSLETAGPRTAVLRLGNPYQENHDAYCAKITSYNNHTLDFNSDLRFHTSNGDNQFANEQMRIDKDGNVGIGTTSPSYKLDVNGSGNFEYLYINGTQILTSYSVPSNAIWQQSTTRLYYTTGNVGIGTNEPHSSSKLHVYNGHLYVYGNSNSSSINEDQKARSAQNGQLFLDCNNYSSAFTGQALLNLRSGINWKTIYNNNSAYTKKSAGILFVPEGNYFRGGLAFYTNNSANQTGEYQQRMHISMDGNVAIGTNTTPNSSYKLDVTGSVRATSFPTTSDDRIKHNEKNITNAIDIITQLQPKKYIKTTEMYEKNHDFNLDNSGNPIDESGNQVDHIIETGLIAQEVREIEDLSVFVKGEETDICGNHTTLNLDYTSIFCYSIQAIKELHEKNQQLEAKNQQLEVKNQQLEATLQQVISRLDAVENIVTN